MAADHPQTELLANIHGSLPELEKVLEFANSEWVAEDMIYRFWHHSLKVYSLQSTTLQIYENLVALNPSKGAINPDFHELISAGTGKVFTLAVNDDWVNITRPIVDAFFHAKFVLSMVVKYGNALRDAPQVLPSGWAAVLYMYSIR